MFPCLTVNGFRPLSQAKAHGLGIRWASLLVPPAFLASASGTCVLQSSMLRNVQVNNDAQTEVMWQCWCKESKILHPDQSLIYKQSYWDEPLI